MITVNLYAFAILVCGGALLTIGDVMFLYWKGHTNAGLYALGLFFYMLGMVFLIKSYRYEGLAVASAMIVIINVLFIAAIGWYFFGQQITVIQGVGILLACTALVFLEIG